MTTIEDRLRLLEDERDILRTLHTYGHAIDYGYEEEFRDCWTEDADLFWGPTEFHGREQLMGAFRAHTHAPSAYHKHLVADPRIHIEGDRATVESIFARLDSYPDGPHILAMGRYLDVLTRCKDGRWRFRERRAEVEAHRSPPDAIIKLTQASSSAKDA